MMKQAWRSYLASLHPSYLRKAYDKGGFFMLIYWFVIYPMIMNATTDNLDYYVIMAYMLMRMLPFLIMNWSNIGSKYLMPKVMYLSPMKEQEREEYIKNVLLIKIGVSLFLGLCIEVIWGLFTGFHIAKVVVIVFVNLSIGVAHLVSDKNKGTNTFAEVMAVLIIVFVVFLEVGTEGFLTVFCNWFIAIAVVLLLILDIVIIRTKYYATILLAGEYEQAFKIEGKVEPKQVKFDLFAK